MIGNEHEAYIEIQCEYGRLAGGTAEEVGAFWASLKDQTSACKSRLVINGQVMEERSAGSEHLRKRVAARLAHAKWNDEDAKLITELAELLGMDVDGMETI